MSRSNYERQPLLVLRWNHNMHRMPGSCCNKAALVGWRLHILTLMETTAWEKSSWQNFSGLAQDGKRKKIAQLLMAYRLCSLFRKTSAEDIRLIIRKYEKDFDICGYHETLNDLRILLKIKTQASKSR